MRLLFAKTNSADRRGGQKTMNPETTTPAPKVGSSAIVRLRRRPLRDQVTYWRELCMKENVERLRLKDAIEVTLRQNAHLADGDVCTLKLLKDSIREPNDLAVTRGANEPPSPAKEKP